MKILVINGPNLDKLGIRERHIYGEESYKELINLINKKAEEMGIEVDIVQSNIEGEIINNIHRAYDEGFDGIIINPAAYTHYSIAIYDALKAVNISAVEVHISNIYGREEYRKKSVTAPACIGQICGFGFYGYIMALEAIVKVIGKLDSSNHSISMQ